MATIVDNESMIVYHGTDSLKAVQAILESGVFTGEAGRDTFTDAIGEKPYFKYYLELKIPREYIQEVEVPSPYYLAPGITRVYAPKKEIIPVEAKMVSRNKEVNMAKPSPWENAESSRTAVTQQGKDIEQAQELTRQALNHMKEKDTIGWLESALWRLVDAAGLLSEYAPRDAVGQQHAPTGLGYSLSTRYPARRREEI